MDILFVFCIIIVILDYIFCWTWKSKFKGFIIICVLIGLLWLVYQAQPEMSPKYKAERDSLKIQTAREAKILLKQAQFEEQQKKSRY